MAPIVFWSVMIDRAQDRPSTGLDLRTPDRAHGAWAIIGPKLIGFWATWAAIAAIYCVFRWYWQEPYLFAMTVLRDAMLPIGLLSYAYVTYVSRYMVNPRDGAWHLGALFCGISGWSGRAIAEHARAWAVKGFFLAFMLSILPGAYRFVVLRPWDEIFLSPFALTTWLIGLMFLIDIVFGTMGYLLTSRLLDAHIRSTEPRVAGWVAALICYPPFVLMGEGRIIDTRHATFGEENWVHWLPNNPLVHALWGAVLVALTGIYAWSTLAFGPRFSNLTHRGIITHGPYAFTKHPAYLSKVFFWWLSVLPFCVTSGKLSDAVRNCVAMGVVSAIYFWRAKTEEAHLSHDPIYRDYADWIARYGLFARIRPRGRRAAAPEPNLP